MTGCTRMTTDRSSSRKSTDQFSVKRRLVTRGIKGFIKRLGTETDSPHVAAAIASYQSLLARGGKRTRGMLTIVGYEMMDGKDTKMIGDAAGIIEALHAYLLVGDDIADVSHLRRGSPTVHIQMQEYFKTLRQTDDPAGNYRLGTDTAQLVALYAQHHAQVAITALDAPAEYKLRAIKIVNDALARTTVGQILDVVASGYDDISLAEIETIALYKTAYYSYLLPLQFGAVLAGASSDRLDDFIDYSLHAGYAFQLRDDVMGLYGSEDVTGKSRKSDISENKKTLLMNDTLAHATPEQQAILRQSLDNSLLTDEQFDECLKVIESTGARRRMEDLIDDHTKKAIAALELLTAGSPPQCIQFLRDMALFGARRQM
jgi:geranylgeranyl diphosphate synthase, type I